MKEAGTTCMPLPCWLIRIRSGFLKSEAFAPAPIPVPRPSFGFNGRCLDRQGPPAGMLSGRGPTRLIVDWWS